MTMIRGFACSASLLVKSRSRLFASQSRSTAALYRGGLRAVALRLPKGYSRPQALCEDRAWRATSPGLVHPRPPINRRHVACEWGGQCGRGIIWVARDEMKG